MNISRIKHALRARTGPLWDGPLWGPWALVGQAFVGPMGLSLGPHVPGPCWASQGAHEPGPFGLGPHGTPWASFSNVSLWPLVQSNSCLILICTPAPGLPQLASNLGLGAYNIKCIIR